MGIGKVYEIGPGKAYENINDVAWENLSEGDTVNIYWREKPYKEKFLIACKGTEEHPVTIRGIAGPQNQLPVIDGEGAVTRTSVDTGETNRGRWVVKVGGPGWDIENKFISTYITIENLEIVGCREEYTYSEWDGKVCHYDTFCAGLWLDRGEHVIIRNCKIHDCGNGLFVNSRDNVEGFFVSRDILVEGNYFYDNGCVGRMYDHNSYCAAIGIVYQFNHYGPLRSGAYGYGLKDRSAGTVVRYNYIEGGRRQISLDDGEDNPLIPADPTYDDAYVYGNVLIENDDGPIRLWGDDEIIHFGGDNAKIANRQGTMYFYNNTVISYRPKRIYEKNSLDLETYGGFPGSEEWTTLGREERTALFLLPSGQHVDARNNIFYAAAKDPAPISMFASTGTIDFSHNWISNGWVEKMPVGWNDPNVDKKVESQLNDDGTNITGSDPGFVNAAAREFHLSLNSQCIGNGTEFCKNLTDLGHNLSLEYNEHKSAKIRKGKMNIGAYGYCE